MARSQTNNIASKMDVDDISRGLSWKIILDIK